MNPESRTSRPGKRLSWRRIARIAGIGVAAVLALLVLAYVWAFFRLAG